MEDSEQRKKRLKEMRMQADLAEATGGLEVFGSGMPVPLSNPLIEASSTMLAEGKSYAAPRFDFYTDPMSAFSSNKKGSNANIQVAPDNFIPPNSSGSPMVQFSSPRLPPPPHRESVNPQMTPSFTQVSPANYRNPVWNGSGGPPHYNFPPHPLSGVSYTSPGFERSGRPLSNSAQGITEWPCHSPNPSPGYSPGPSPGRGRGCWYNNRSPGSGQGGGRRLSSHGRFSNEDKPCDLDRFYKKSMVEDPWQLLKPLMWKVTDASNILYTPESSKSWTSKSLSTKRGGPSATAVKPSSQQSLAEYLAAAFNEAANGAENV